MTTTMNPAERAYWGWLGYAPEEYGRLCRDEGYGRALAYLDAARCADDAVVAMWVAIPRVHDPRRTT